MNTKLPPLRESSFRAWLAKQDPDYVGEANTDTECPIATWLHDAVGRTCRVVSGVDVWQEPQGYVRVRRLPQWGAAFVKGVDSTHRLRGEGQYVTRAEAFEILDLVDAGAWGPEDAA